MKSYSSAHKNRVVLKKPLTFFVLFAFSFHLLASDVDSLQEKKIESEVDSSVTQKTTLADSLEKEKPKKEVGSKKVFPNDYINWRSWKTWVVIGVIGIVVFYKIIAKPIQNLEGPPF